MTTVPNRKISETILAFSHVVYPAGAPPLPLDAARSLFQVVITVWNAHAMAMPPWDDQQHLARLHSMVAKMPPEMAQLIAALSAHRLEQFADYPRAVGEWSIVADKANGFLLRCDARLPATSGKMDS